MARMRTAIVEGRFEAFANETLARLGTGGNGENQV